MISIVKNTLLEVITLLYHDPCKIKCDPLICNPNNICPDHIIATCPILNKQSVPVNCSSRKFMCSLLSGRDQMPLMVQSPKCVPHPSFDASVEILKKLVLQERN